MDVEEADGGATPRKRKVSVGGKDGKSPARKAAPRPKKVSSSPTPGPRLIVRLKRFQGVVQSPATGPDKPRSHKKQAPKYWYTVLSITDEAPLAHVAATSAGSYDSESETAQQSYPLPARPAMGGYRDMQRPTTGSALSFFNSMGSPYDPASPAKRSKMDEDETQFAVWKRGRQGGRARLASRPPHAAACVDEVPQSSPRTA
jgi:hypothetical protein